MMVMILLFIAVFSGTFALYVSRRDVAERIAVSAVSLWLIYESVLGMKQLIGDAVSMNSMYPMTGSFSNPGPYGGFIAVCGAVALYAAWKWHGSENRTERVLSWLSGIAGMSGMMVLPASMSRTAWAASAVAVFVFMMALPAAVAYLKSHRWIFPAGVVLIAAVSVGAFCLKRDSASGRFHIWEMECRAIAEKPLFGHGAGKASGAYGDAQAKYFESAERSPERIRIAGCPEYSFNEYLRIGMEFGIPVMLLSLAAMVAGIMLLFHAESALTYGMIVWGVFALASYPLAVWQLVVLLAVFSGAATGICLHGRTTFRISAASCSIVIAVLCSVFWYRMDAQRKTAEYRWHEEQRFAAYGIRSGVADSLALLYPLLRTEFRFLYDYGHALHEDGRYEESNRILLEGTSRSSDPMFHDIIGKNLEASGDFAGAERSYMHAHFMVPSRLYPYILLMEMEDRRGNRKKAVAYAEKVLSMPVNVRNAAMAGLHEKAERYYEAWKDN